MLPLENVRIFVKGSTLLPGQLYLGDGRYHDRGMALKYRTAALHSLQVLGLDCLDTVSRVLTHNRITYLWAALISGYPTPYQLSA